MINIEGVKKVADTFAMLAEQYPGEAAVQMDSTTIQHTIGCGTYACHAGWFMYAHMEDNTPGTWTCYQDVNWYKGRNGSLVSFDDGANCMATIMGFTDTGCMTPAEALEQWAANNPDIWGNRHGRAMFYSAAAFDPAYSGFDMPLRTVADHWKGVYERLCAAAVA